MTKNIIVTGIAGFIGSSLAVKLIERGDRVIGIDNINDYYSVQLKRDRLARLGPPHTSDWAVISGLQDL